MNLPNLLTATRIALIPIFVLLYIVPTPTTQMVAAVFFAVAAATDWLDGYLARRLGQTTPFGAFLDPVADKLITVAALVLLVGAYDSLWLTLPGLIIIGREIVISALREWMAEMNRRGLVAVVGIAKIKTVVQMVAITLLLGLPTDFAAPLVIAAFALLYVAVLMTLWTMVLYLRAAWPTLMDGLTARTSKSS